MAKKKKETSISDLLLDIDISNETVTSSDISLQVTDPSYYIHIYHPFRKDLKIYIRSFEAFVLANNIIEINRLIAKDKKMTDELKEKVNELILLVKLIESYNNIEPKMYKCVIKNKKLYIL